jgi:hypothetical protein
MIVWNGSDGAAYDPGADAWRRLPDLPVEERRYDDTAVWTGKEMIVWGGDPSGGQDGFQDGPAYNARRGPMAEGPARPDRRRYQHAAAWTGKQMLVWGGRCAGDRFYGDGAVYSASLKPGVPSPPRRGCAPFPAWPARARPALRSQVRLSHRAPLRR